jgi:predicted dithiol-disulfide oxidoreductase (DUF899 family)
MKPMLILWGFSSGGMEARHVDSIWPIWNVLDVTPEGRGTDSSFAALRYD